MEIPKLHGEQVLIADLVRLLGKLQLELVVLVGEDGWLYLSHRTSPDDPVARIGLRTDPATVEQIDTFPGLWTEWLNLDEYYNSRRD